MSPFQRKSSFECKGLILHLQWSPYTWNSKSSPRAHCILHSYILNDRKFYLSIIQRRIKRLRAATFSWMEGKKIESITRAMADTSKTRALNERLCKYARARLGWDNKRETRKREVDTITLVARVNRWPLFAIDVWRGNVMNRPHSDSCIFMQAYLVALGHAIRNPRSFIQHDSIFSCFLPPFVHRVKRFSARMILSFDGIKKILKNFKNQVLNFWIFFGLLGLDSLALERFMIRFR